MKISLDSKLESSTKEVVTITMTFDPANPTDDGLASMVMAVCDTVRQLTLLQEAVNSNE